VTSFSLKSDPRRRSFVRLIGDIRYALNTALGEEHKDKNLTKSDVAKILKTNKSFVTRKLSGESNMTLATLSDLAFALNRTVNITLPSKRPAEGSNYVAEPREVASPVTRGDAPIVTVSGV
jgi:hypothetical protein